MKINSITIDNVKSFKNRTEIKFLQDFNILIGPNGSGKSNLMDILGVVIREYFLTRYKINENHYGNGVIFQAIMEPSQLGESLQNQLEPFINNSAEQPSIIEIEFIVQQQDLDNIKEICTHSSDLRAILKEKYGFQGQDQNYIQHFDSINLWNTDDIDLHVGQKLSYTIRNKNLEGTNLSVSHRFFKEYLNCFELMVLLAKDSRSTIQLVSPYFYMGPCRIGSSETLRACLSTNNQYEALYKYISATSKNICSAMEISASYFARKHRKYEQNPEGCQAQWDIDAEVVKVNEYLGKIGYEWELQIADREKNIYDIILKENDRSFSLDQASSGEKEICNFIFGIYAFQLRNGIIVIDEPELHLHPRWQKLLLSLFKHLSEDTGNQFIISTHASAFVNEQSYNHVHRIYKNESKESCHSPYEAKKDISLSMIHQLVHATNNEQVFFADLIILVEGITDRLVFQKIVQDAQKESPDDRRIIEVVELKGKTNQESYRVFLEGLKIPNYLIVDLDYIQDADKTGRIKNLLMPNKAKIAQDVMKNPKSYDGQKLFEAMEAALKTRSWDDVDGIWKHINTTRTKLKTKLTEDEQQQLHAFIEEQRRQQVFILENGDIEKYFAKDFQSKNLENVLKQLNDEHYPKWRQSKSYSALRKIVDEILKYPKPKDM